LLTTFADADEFLRAVGPPLEALWNALDAAGRAPR
jgi:hypothetical protein